MVILNYYIPVGRRGMGGLGRGGKMVEWKGLKAYTSKFLMRVITSILSIGVTLLCQIKLVMYVMFRSSSHLNLGEFHNSNAHQFKIL
jgi:hypothetical protein